MKRNIIFAVFIFYLCFSCFSNTELESLWTKVRLYNVELHTAEYSIEYANNVLKNKKSLYPFSLSSNLNSVFSDIYSDVAWYTTNSDVTLSISKKNPFGNNISSSVSYELGRSVLNYFTESINADNIGYSHIPKFSFSVEQSVFPAFFQGIKIDPDVEILRKNVFIAIYSKEAIEKSLIENFTYYYIQERCILRILEKCKEYINYYDSRIDAAKQMFNNSQTSHIEIFDYENKKWDYYEDYIDALNNKENLELNLKNLCGDSLAVFSLNSKLPDKNQKIFTHDPSIEKILMEMEILKLQNVLDKQDFAPSVTMSGSISETTDVSKSITIDFVGDKNFLTWNFSLGVDFSDLFSSKNKLREQLYKNNLSTYKEQLNFVREQNNNQLENYQELINSCSQQLHIIYDISRNRQEVFDDYKLMYKNGKCSKFDLEEIYLNLIEANCIYENLKDYLWFYEWKRTQCK